MATVFENDEQIKEAFRSAIVEVLRKRKDLVREIIEDAAFSRAIDAGIASPKVSREQVFEILETAN